MALALAADGDLSAAAVDGALLRLSDLAPATRAFTWLPLDGAHPLDVLLGFRAPAALAAARRVVHRPGRHLRAGGEPHRPGPRATL